MYFACVSSHRKGPGDQTAGAQPNRRFVDRPSSLGFRKDTPTPFALGRFEDHAMFRTFAAVTSRPAGHAYHVAVIRAQVMPEIVVPGPAELCTPVSVIVVFAPDPVFVHEPGPHAAGRPGVLLLHPSVAELQEPLVGDPRDQRRPVGRPCDKTRTKRGLAENTTAEEGIIIFPSSSTMRYTNVLSTIAGVVYVTYTFINYTGGKNDRLVLVRQSFMANAN